MKVRWTHSAIQDIARLHAFVAQLNPVAARRIFARLKQAPRMLEQEPRLSSRSPAFAPREVRRLVLDDYEVRYEVADDTIIMLRIWHTREDRQ